MVRRLVKVLAWIVGSVVVLALAVGAARVVNHYRYPQPDLPFPTPADPVSYPTSLPGVGVTRVDDGPVQGFHLLPDDLRHAGVVLAYGGSEGGPDFLHARLLAEAGFEVYSLFFFGQPGQPETLDRVPVETVSRAVDRAEAGARRHGPVTVVGTSEGAELAALAPTYEPRIRNVVLFAPVDHVTQGLGNVRTSGSSWTAGGTEVPYASFQSGREFGPVVGLMTSQLLGAPMLLRPVYEVVLRAPGADEARIDVSRIPGELLVFAGADDQLWPSPDAAERMRTARPERTEVHVYDGAGHVFEVPGSHADGMRLGGSAEANAAAREDSDRVLVERLTAWHR